MLNQKIFSASLMVAGLCIGGAMVGMPAALAPLGLLGSLVLLLCCFGLMLLTALLTYELACYGKEGTHFLHMAKSSLGPVGEWVISACYVILLYALLSAYLSGAFDMSASILHLLDFHVSALWVAGFILLLLALLVGSGVSRVASFNRWLMLGMLISFVGIITFFSGDLHDNLLVHPVNAVSAIPSALMVALTSFGFHILIPTIKQYLDNVHRRAFSAFFIGALIAVSAYVVWILFVYYLTDASSLIAIREGELGPSEILAALSRHTSHVSLVVFGQGFLLLALLTSFVGVLISLLDFFIDAFPIKKSQNNRLLLLMLCLAVPLIFIMTIPYGFIIALQYAGLMVLILHGIFPCIAVLIQRRRHEIARLPVIIPGYLIVLLLGLFLFIFCWILF